MQRLLIIDDESGFTRLLKLTLENTGRFTVRELNDGRKAIDTAREFLPDIIFLDIVMPDTDGGEVARALKADAQFRDVPIIFLTAIASKQEEQAGKHIEGFPFLAKPVSLEAIMACAEQYAKKL